MRFLKSESGNDGLTPDVEPELLQTRAAQAVDAEHGDGRAGKRLADDEAVVPRVLAKGQAPGGGSETTNQTDLASFGVHCTPGLEDQEPHGKGKTAEGASQPLRDVREEESPAPDDAAGGEGGKEIQTLELWADWWIADIYDQYLDVVSVACRK